MATSKNTKGKTNNGGSQANVQDHGLMALESRVLFSAAALVSDVPEPVNDDAPAIEASLVPGEAYSIRTGATVGDGNDNEFPRGTGHNSDSVRSADAQRLSDSFTDDVDVSPPPVQKDFIALELPMTGQPPHQVDQTPPCFYASVTKQGNVIKINGTLCDDFVEVSRLTPSPTTPYHIQVTVFEDQERSTVQSTKTFFRPDISVIVFDGNAGDDHLWNGHEESFTYYPGPGTFETITVHVERHSLMTFAYGGPGDDHLEGSMWGDSLYGGPGNDIIYGNDGSDIIHGDADPLRSSSSSHPDGDDTLYGGSGMNMIFGGGGDDTLIGGDHTDHLHGNNGHDNLYGQGGIDYLYGGKGLDGLYGGNDKDHLTGGPGSDRFLHQKGDTLHDKKRRDARINFQDGNRSTSLNYEAGSWTQDEIQLVDVALRDLHMKTKDDTLLETKKGMRLRFSRLGAVIDTTKNEKIAGFNNKRQRRISLTDQAFLGDDNPVLGTVFHEMAHNWDKEHGSYGTWKTLSGWTKYQKNNPAYQISLDGQWRHCRNAHFASDYAKHDPREDFAETFAAIFMEERGAEFHKNFVAGHCDNKAFDPGGDMNLLDIGDLHAKRNHINHWLDGLAS